MPSLKTHPQEKRRLKVLHSYNILDSLPEEEYDQLTAIASQICGTPVSLVSLIDEDRQWFKSAHGISVRETPRELAVCHHTINHDDDIMVVEDARLDPRFMANPLVKHDPKMVFYAGVKLKADDDMPLGALCVIDHRPRQLNLEQIEALKGLANNAMKLIELRRKNIRLQKTEQELRKRNQELARFATLVAHDIKTPLGQLQGISDLMQQQYGLQLDAEGKQMLNMMTSASRSLAELVDGLLAYSRCDQASPMEKKKIAIADLEDKLKGFFNFASDCIVEFKSELAEITANALALERILINLVANAYKYNEKECCHIQIEIVETPYRYQVDVSDNGPGIALADRERIFQIFETAGKCRDGQPGHGIGLAEVKKLVKKMGGEINLTSTLGQGCCFSFSLEKEL